ncbi:hypothetical protein JCM10207_005551 [Rhodosporidiobolus poonsookiae]
MSCSMSLVASTSSSTSSSSASPSSWRDAPSSPYSPSSPADASTSASSLWTASSAASSTPDLSLDASSSGSGDDSDEARCEALLQQLEQERRRVVERCGGERPSYVRETAARRAREVQRMQEVQDGVFGSYSLGGSPVAGPSHSPRYVPQLNPSASLASLSTVRPSPSCTSLKRSSRSRRLSFTRTDIADLDIDAILDAYACEVPFEAPAGPPSAVPHTPPRRSVPRSKSSANLRTFRQDIFPSPPVASPSSVRTLDGGRPQFARSRTARSSASSHSQAPSQSSIQDELFPHRRVAPFPTMQRKKSAVSIRSTSTSTGSGNVLNLAQAPPLPPLPLPPTPSSQRVSTRPASNRTFSSFARQSTCSTASTHSFASSASSAASRSPSLSSSPHLASSAMRKSYTSSIHSSSAASSSCGNSIRWSVATASTAPSSAFSSCASDDACSRRGSVLFPPASPARRGSLPRFRLADELTEEEHDEDADDERAGRDSFNLARSAESDSDDRDAGLISWEDFAHELDALPPPRKAAVQPSSAASAGPFAARPTAPFRTMSTPAAAPFPSAPATPQKRPSKEMSRAGGLYASTAGLKSKLSLATLKVR